MKKDGKEIFYKCDISPEHLYYNILYHITTDNHSTNEEREKAIRNKSKSKTTQYEIGDVVGTLTKKYVYCGIIYKHWDSCLNFEYFKGSWDGIYSLTLTKSIKPKKMHLYMEYDERSKSIKDYSWNIEVRDRKLPYTNYEEKYSIDTLKAFELCNQWNEIGCYSIDEKSCLNSEEVVNHYRKTMGVELNCFVR